jgi:hypothetical protein
VTGTRARAHQQPNDVRAVLLQEKDVARLLLVDVASDDAQRLLVLPRLEGVRRGCASPPARDALLDERGDVVVEEGVRLLLDLETRIGPLALGLRARDQPLDDESVGRLGQQDLAHLALVDEGADRTEDLFVFLPGASVVDAHQPSRWTRRIRIR